MLFGRTGRSHLRTTLQVRGAELRLNRLLVPLDLLFHRNKLINIPMSPEQFPASPGGSRRSRQPYREPSGQAQFISRHGELGFGGHL